MRSFNSIRGDMTQKETNEKNSNAMEMKPFSELNLGFADATNYRRRENKDLFMKFFVLDKRVEKLLDPNVYFLIGGKGTGKTAYSTFLANNEYKDTASRSVFIDETEYTKFISLKGSKNLELSDYPSIWKVILLLLVSQQLRDGETGFTTMRNYSSFEKLQNAIDQFYNKAFSPEIAVAFNIIEKSEIAADLFAKYLDITGSITGKRENANSMNGSIFQINLLTLERQFKETISKLKLAKNHVLFIDGIDIRPKRIPYEEYLSCVKGLSNAVWSLNNEFFSSIKDSKGRIKVVLLLRPDIFAELGLQNANNKLRDNSVLLDWQTTYPRYRDSSIFRIADTMLSVQQDDSIKNQLGDSWDYYFPFKIDNDDSFIHFLRYSLYRPRDILTLMRIIQDVTSCDNNNEVRVITKNDFDDSSVKSRYSAYLLGEIHDFLAFYHSEEDYNLFLKFFEYLNGATTFTYDQFIDAYDEFGKYVESNNKNVPSYLENSGDFLQFLYDMDIICFITENEDSTKQYHWSFRERNYSNLRPQIQEGVTYRIHYGLQKSLNTGKKSKRHSSILINQKKA